MKKESWTLRWESIHPLYRMELFFSGHKKRLVLGSEYTKLFCHSQNNKVSMYYLDDDLKKNEKRSLKLLTNKTLMENYFVTSINNYNKLLSETKLLTVNINNLSDKEIWYKYNRIYKLLEILFCSYDLSRPEFFVPVQKKINEYLRKKGVDDNKIDNVFITLSTNTEQTILDKEESERELIVLNFIKNQSQSDFDKMIRYHSNKYGWLGTSESKHHWTSQYFKDLMKDDLRLNLKAMQKKIRAKKRNNQSFKTKQANLLKKYQIDGEIKYLLLLIQKTSHLRLNIRLKWVESGYLIQKMFQEIAKRKKIKAVDLNNYFKNEIKNLLFNNQRVSTRMIKQRDKYVSFLENKKIKFYYDKDADKVVATRLLKRNYNKTLELKGRIAHTGFVRARAKVIYAFTKNQELEIASMKKGQVLVTGMTRPHMIAAFKKASAIITDEGGITCHAAIISRELGIPCIIGTKIATKIIKDNDLLEVDAKKGIVKKLS